MCHHVGLFVLLKEEKEKSPQFFTETSQVGEPSQSFIVLRALSVCVKEVHQRPYHLIHL